MNRNKMMPATRFLASNVIAKRIDTGDGNVGAAVTDATQRLINMGMRMGMAAEMAQDVRYRLEGDTELHRYQRLLAPTTGRSATATTAAPSVPGQPSAPG